MEGSTVPGPGRKDSIGGLARRCNSIPVCEAHGAQHFPQQSHIGIAVEMSKSTRPRSCHPFPITCPNRCSSKDWYVSFSAVGVRPRRHQVQRMQKGRFGPTRPLRGPLCFCPRSKCHGCSRMHTCLGLPDHIKSTLQTQTPFLVASSTSSNSLQTGQYNAQNQRPAKNSVIRPVGNYALAFSPCRACSSLLAPEASQLENFQ